MIQDNALKNKDKIEIGIFLFNEADVLDFAGPFEVFSLAKIANKKLFSVYTIGETGHLITARNGFKVTPGHSISNHPVLDILIIPGGYGAEEVEIKNKKVLDWIKAQYKNLHILASVCTGVILLAEGNILDNKRATTHWLFLDRLETEYPKINVIRNVKYVDEGKLITSAGISAGIHMSLHIIKRIFGDAVAEATAKRMEYDMDIRDI